MKQIAFLLLVLIGAMWAFMPAKAVQMNRISAPNELYLLVTTAELEKNDHSSTEYSRLKLLFSENFLQDLRGYEPKLKSFIIRTGETEQNERFLAVKAKVLQILPEAKINQMTAEQMKQLKN